jgi:formylglycine-generating enzyme required for sulfatase activity
MNLVRIESGTFLMGTPDVQIQLLKWLYPVLKTVDILGDEQPAHQVRVSKPFYLGAYEVTVGQFEQFVDETGYKTDAERDGRGGRALDMNKTIGVWLQGPTYTWRNPGFPQTDKHPVINVSWNDALAFCSWLNTKKDGYRYRLPTEAEWEYACRAGSGTLFPTGSLPESLVKVGNVPDASLKQKYPVLPTGKYPIRGDDGQVYTAPVGSYAANAWGLYDMVGNVWEWCHDYYAGDYYKQSPPADPQGPAVGKDRVLRGGGWVGNAWHCRPAQRLQAAPVSPDILVGFRVAADRE